MSQRSLLRAFGPQRPATPMVGMLRCVRRPLAWGARGLVTKHEEGGKADFKGQLWQSTTDRVQREKEEQARFAQRRQLGGGAGAELGRLIGSHPLDGISSRQRCCTIFLTYDLLGFLGLALGAYYLGTMNSTSPSTASTLPLSDTVPPRHDISTSTMQAAWADFKNVVGAENITTEPSELESHSGSSWSSHPSSSAEVPFAVVRPASTDEVSKIMKICHNRRIPVTGYSGGTSLEGHFAATRGGICIDFSRMDKIIALHKEDLDVVVQPALGWELLNTKLAEDGLFFPPDPGPGAMIGGMVGTGCSGTNAYRYGTMKDWVLSLTVVLADGTVIKTRQRPRKSSAGYDLTRTFIGSEGTLGLVTEATLRLIPAPQNVRVAVCSFKSVRDAAECVFQVVGAGVPIAAVEILDDVQMKCINDAGMTSKEWKEAPTLFFKFSGTQSGVKESIGIVQKLAKGNGSTAFDFAKNQEEADELWSARKEALWSVMAQMEGDVNRVWTTDVAVPISALPTIIEETKKDLTNCGLLGSIVGHVGDGNFHSILIYSDGERKVAEEVVHRMVKRAIEMEGTATGEHGVGLGKRDYLEHELGSATVDVMRKMKQAFDPLCLLNCDKIVRSVPPKRGEVQEW